MIFSLVFLTLLSAASLLVVAQILTQPSCAVERPIFVPELLDVPDMTFDHGGLA